MCCDVGAIGDHHLWSIGGIWDVLLWISVSQGEIVVTGASINNSSERVWGSTLLWHKQTILSMFYVHTCCPSMSGVASIEF